MSPSLKALLIGLIDYAGLFPPAKLPLPEALRNYARYATETDAWMLGRFICPASRLGELFATETVLTVSALGRGGPGTQEFLAGLRADLADIAACRQRLGDRVVIDVLEARLPAGMAASREALAGAAELTRSSGLRLFFETPTPARATLPALVAKIRETAFAASAGFKLRTGGLEPSAFPAAEEIAFALGCCQAASVPFKATAGLHHPFPRFDPAVGARMHGFINLFTAGVLAHALPIGTDPVRDILEDAEPSHFRFDDEGVDWQGMRASTEAIALARQQAVLSFGSCSFDEPRDDLRALGWM